MRINIRNNTGTFDKCNIQFHHDEMDCPATFEQVSSFQDAIKPLLAWINDNKELCISSVDLKNI